MKNRDETLESNKLIAEFVGLNTRHSTEFLYHTSWDWLMPVVEKIQEILLSPEFSVNLYKNGGADHYHLFNGVTLLDITYKGVYEAVVEFIKWYNEK